MVVRGCRAIMMTMFAALALAAIVPQAAPAIPTAQAAPAALAAPAAAVDTRIRIAGFSSADVARVDRLLLLIQRRLEQAPHDAEVKWTSMTRIEDSEGEQRAIESVRSRSARAGVDSAVATAYAQSQIDAVKSIQAARHRQWALDARSAPARNSERAPMEIVYQSPKADPALTDAELRALRDALGVLRRVGGRRLLDARAADHIRAGGDLLAGQTALKPLYAVAK